MAVPVVGFDWDHGNREKCEKHGVSIPLIERLFRGPIAVFPDPQHSAREERFKAIGSTAEGRGVLMIFTLRVRDGQTLIRPISARFMRRKELEYYEEEAAKAT